MKSLDLDGARLHFDRRTGENVLVRGLETAELRQTAPRVVQMSLTNACNKTCGFCYRPLESKSRWTAESVMELATFLSEWGVLELAVGGGEPTVFPRFAELVKRIWEETELAVNFTTNGTRLTPEFLQSIKGYVGQIQVSVYDDEDVDAIIALLVEHDMRFGLNYLVTPRRLRTLDFDLMRWHAKGVRDVLLLSYKGETATHLCAEELADLDARIVKCFEYFGDTMQLKVDVCWANRLPNAPQLFYDDDCRAGALFMSITSDRKVVSCSFAGGGESFESVDEIPAIYQKLKRERRAAQTPGCARLDNFGIPAELEPAIDYPEVRL